MMKKVNIFIFLIIWYGLFSGLQADDGILTLESAIQRALARNEQALSADQSLRASESRVGRARAYFLPQISATGNYLRRPFQVSRVVGGTEIVIQSYNALSGVLALNLTIFDAQGIPSFRNIRSEKMAQEYATMETKRQLVFEVSNAYLGTLGVDQVLEAARNRYEYARQALDAAKARYSAGLVGVNDVTRAELEFATAEMGVTQVKGQVETTYLQLGYLIDDPETPRKRLEEPGFLPRAAEDITLSAEQLVSEAQNRRLDLNSLRWHARAQHALALTPTLKWFPSLSFNAQYRYTNEAGLTGRNTNWNAGLTLSWAIFDGFNRNAEYGERKALAVQSDLDVQAGMRQVDLQVREALVSLENQKASLKQAAVAYDAAKRNATEIAELYRQGLASALQVADANVSLFEAEVTLVRERYGLGISYLNLEAALGLDPFGKEPKL
jgi:outer membrane protein TolC